MGRDTVTGFAARLRALREAAGLTQTQLAEKTGTHQTTIVKLEREERAPSFRLAVALAESLGVAVGDLAPEHRAAAERRKILRKVQDSD